MASKPPVGSIKNWNPGQGGSDNNTAKLMSTEAKDSVETMNATNEQKEWVGGNGTPKGPFGAKGKEF